MAIPTPMRICESHVEELALNWFDVLEWSVLHGLETAIGDHR
jgi:hypothetical protein